MHLRNRDRRRLQLSNRRLRDICASFNSLILRRPALVLLLRRPALAKKKTITYGTVKQMWIVRTFLCNLQEPIVSSSEYSARMQSSKQIYRCYLEVGVFTSSRRIFPG